MNAQDQSGFTSIIPASLMRYYDIVKYLFFMGVDTQLRGLDGSNVLLEAAHDGCLDVMKLLLSAGDEVNVNNQERLTPLIQVVNFRALEMFKFLIGYGADLNFIVSCFGAFAVGMANDSTAYLLNQYGAIRYDIRPMQAHVSIKNFELSQGINALIGVC